jgi:hypothetical protein
LPGTRPTKPFSAARAQRADDDVALGDVRHAPAGQLEEVVDPLLLERLDDQHRAGPRFDGR